MNKLDCGDLFVEDVERLGVNIVSKDGKHLAFFNAKGATELRHWLEEREANVDIPVELLGGVTQTPLPGRGSHVAGAESMHRCDAEPPIGPSLWKRRMGDDEVRIGNLSDLNTPQPPSSPNTPADWERKFKLAAKVAEAVERDMAREIDRVRAERDKALDSLHAAQRNLVVSRAAFDEMTRARNMACSIADDAVQLRDDADGWFAKIDEIRKIGF